MSKLLPGENLVLQDHPHWITVVKSAVVPVVLLVVVAVADFTILGPDYGFYTPNLRKVLSALVIAIALLWFIVVWIRWHFFFQAEDGIRDLTVTGVQTCALPI